jgi:ribonuclease P protein component
MLKKKHRLSRREFETLLKKGRRFSGTHLTLLTAKISHAVDIPKFSVVVSKKTAKRATARNLVRRRVYALLQGYVGLQGTHNALYAKPSIVTRSFEEINQELANLFERAMRDSREPHSHTPKGALQ